ncbi:MAG: LptF/LptG family permease [Sulfurospirillum sp.]|nr:LptF/LptG family permease [Sulfurospirillum sp.]
MKIFQRYIIVNYIKNLLIIFISLELFYVGVDLLSNFKDLPDSANIQLLYVVFKILDAINYTLPLSSVFAMIVTKFTMIKSNELVSMYSVGIRKNSVIAPLFLVASIFMSIFAALHFTSFTYANEYSQNLLRYSTISNSSSNLFLKDKDQYIYFKTLDPIKKNAQGIKIFEVKDNDLEKIISADNGYFFNNRWILKNVQVLYKPKALGIGDTGLKEILHDRYEALENFRPKIMDNIFKSEYTLSTLDAFDAYIFFNAQDINTKRIRAIIYTQMFLPFFAPLLIIILFHFLPISSRFFNLTFLSFIFTLIALFTWGILFLLSKLSYGGVILPEIALILPLFILALISFRVYFKSS